MCQYNVPVLSKAYCTITRYLPNQFPNIVLNHGYFVVHIIPIIIIEMPKLSACGTERVCAMASQLSCYVVL